MNQKGKIIGIVLMLIIGIALLYFAFYPPRFLIFLHGNAGGIGSGLIGGFFILAGIMNAFHKEK